MHIATVCIEPHQPCAFVRDKGSACTRIPLCTVASEGTCDVATGEREACGVGGILVRQRGIRRTIIKADIRGALFVSCMSACMKKHLA